MSVLGIELEGRRAVGVKLRKGRRGTEAVRTAREVLLCAGAIGSPQLLLASGVGPSDDLAEAGVHVRHALDGVG
ncbi:MAG TPA: GMC family oxidoreductase N-terminal domain-containing protein, partial [Solirubrobacteraceae bacterium]|nr:GMC family oxidoreductase N-terminal domain-containing protein [Solirubrobacteraceae bacterium]